MRSGPRPDKVKPPSMIDNQNTEIFFKHRVPRFEQEPVIFETDNEASVVNIVPEVMLGNILTAKGSHGILFGMDERDLKATLRKKGVQLTKTDNCLRIKFWIEYERAISTGARFNESNVYAGVCSKEYFKLEYMRKPERVAWLLTPPLDYESGLIEALDYGNDQMRDILELPHKDPATGKLDHKLMELKMKIRNMIESRLLGGIVQRSQGQLAVTAIDATQKKVKEYMEGMTDAELDQKLKSYEVDEYAVFSEAPPEPEIKDILTEQSEVAVEKQSAQ